MRGKPYQVLVFLLPALLVAGPGRAPAAEKPSRAAPGRPQAARPRPQLREFAEMLLAVLQGSQMGPGDGWFHPGQSRYGWRWLADRMDANGDGKIDEREFRGPAALFRRLDRNHDGVLTAADFDWSASRPDPSGLWFYLLDTNSNGRVSRAEWEAFFARASRGKGYLTPDDLREALQPPWPSDPKAAGPSPLVLLKGLFTGELGSFHEGPRVGESAPDFTLRTFDGKCTIRLSEFRGKKPVVLVFGSFT
jgi:hypothetical protein